jgi:hypothetical protein
MRGWATLPAGARSSSDVRCERELGLKCEPCCSVAFWMLQVRHGWLAGQTRQC